MMLAGYDVDILFREAQTRWLKPAEVLFILQNYDKYELTQEPPQKPNSELRIKCIGLKQFIHSFLVCSKFASYFQQVDLCFCLIRESSGFSVRMVIIGVKRRTGGLLGRHTNALRFVKKISTQLPANFFFQGFILLFSKKTQKLKDEKSPMCCFYDK